MTRFVFDASAVIALLQSEPGADKALRLLPGSLISAVNVSEVLGWYARRGVAPTAIEASFSDLKLTVVEFEYLQAVAAAELVVPTKSLGLSLGDRACLALAATKGLRALTTDRAWLRLNIGVRVELMRD